MRHARSSSRFLLVVSWAIFIPGQLGVTNADMANCKTKVRDVAIKYCQGARFSRSVQSETVEKSPENEDRQGFPPGPDPMADTDERRVGYLRCPVPPLVSSDENIGANLSHEDFEDLFEEVGARFPRASKHKDQTMKMLAMLVAKCCNGNLNDGCDPTNVITCPS